MEIIVIALTPKKKQLNGTISYAISSDSIILAHKKETGKHCLCSNPNHIFIRGIDRNYVYVDFLSQREADIALSCYKGMIDKEVSPSEYIREMRKQSNECVEMPKLDLAMIADRTTMITEPYSPNDVICVLLGNLFIALGCFAPDDAIIDTYRENAKFREIYNNGPLQICIFADFSQGLFYTTSAKY